MTYTDKETAVMRDSYRAEIQTSAQDLAGSIRAYVEFCMNDRLDALEKRINEKERPAEKIRINTHDAAGDPVTVERVLVKEAQEYAKRIQPKYAKRIQPKYAKRIQPKRDFEDEVKAKLRECLTKADSLDEAVNSVYRAACENRDYLWR